MKHKTLHCFFLVLISIFVSCNSNLSKDEFFKTVTSKTNNKDYKYYYFNIWNKSCIPCIKEMPSLDSLSIEYKELVAFIFITSDTEQDVMNIITKKSIILSNSYLINDAEDLITYLKKEINISNIVYPTHIILDKKGNIKHTHTGAIQGDIFDPILTKKLKSLK